MMRTKENIVILIVAFVLFAGGIWALSIDRGNDRTILLTGIVAAMLCLVVRVSLHRPKKGK